MIVIAHIQRLYKIISQANFEDRFQNMLHHLNNLYGFFGFRRGGKVLFQNRVSRTWALFFIRLWSGY